jgi:hypothetical protein
MLVFLDLVFLEKDKKTYTLFMLLFLLTSFLHQFLLQNIGNEITVQKFSSFLGNFPLRSGVGLNGRHNDNRPRGQLLKQKVFHR